MTPELNRIYQGDNRAILKGWPDACVDAVVTDPPYELGFMGKAWDSTGIAYDSDLWREVLRVMKPGAHLLAFGGTRTYHRMACAIEDAGFEIREQLQWLYGSGFPKSLDISKAIDKAAGIAREDKFEGAFDRRAGPTGNKKCEKCGKWLVSGSPCKCPRPQDAPVSEAARAWDGWGTALKPANEPIVLARKPLSEGTVAANVLKWGTGAINIEASRIKFASDDDKAAAAAAAAAHRATRDQNENRTAYGRFENGAASLTPYLAGMDAGRWPANILFDRYAAGILDGKSPEASRFFYVAKPDGEERNGGLEDEETVSGGTATDRQDGSAGLRSPRAGAGRTGGNQNFHPTVKPVDLMSYLIKLVTPPGGVVLDPFMGSGTTGIAAARLGVPFLGCELNPDYIAIAEKRIAPELSQGKLL